MNSPGRKTTVQPDFSHVSQALAADFLNITPAGLGQSNAPRNPDRTYNLKLLHDWRVGQLKNIPSDRDDLEKEKLSLQIEKMQFELQDMKSKNIPLETHRQILCGRAVTLKLYWTETFMRNLHHFANKSLEDLRPLAERFIREALNNFAKNHD